jgi:isopropylmalate/homocitrate/citramalate synthase
VNPEQASKASADEIRLLLEAHAKQQAKLAEEAAARAKELKAVSIKPEDATRIAEEFALPPAVAETLLRKAGGDVNLALRRLVLGA